MKSLDNQVNLDKRQCQKVAVAIINDIEAYAEENKQEFFEYEKKIRNKKKGHKLNEKEKNETAM